MCLSEVMRSVRHEFRCTRRGDDVQSRGVSEDESGSSGEDQEQGRKVEFDHDGIDGWGETIQTCFYTQGGV